MKGHKKQHCSKSVDLVLSDGSHYFGATYNDQPSGHGTWTSPTGTTYMGYFDDGKRQGYGVERRDDGSSYDGYWHSGLYQGCGKLVLSSGTTYHGTFRLGVYHGTGFLINPDGTTYKGQWKQGRMHGLGKYTSELESYVGRFESNLRHGAGTVNTKGGEMYSGTWRHNARHGQGVSTTGEEIYNGNWVRGRRSGHGHCVSTRTGDYEGEWYRNQRHGRGTNRYKDGSSYKGDWKQGQRHGFGVFTHADGYYKGFWDDNGYHGKGEWHCGTTLYNGHWEHGQRQGLFELLVRGTPKDEHLQGPYCNDVRHGTFTSDIHPDTFWLWGEQVEFESPTQARKILRNLVVAKDLLGAIAVAEHTNVVTWRLVYKHDTEGGLLRFLDRETLETQFAKYAWKLFLDNRYVFLETMVEELKLEAFDSVLFDSILQTFVANPWLRRNQGYSEQTKKKLLAGLHLGEFGRCPPKDPFTREPLTETSGTYLDQDIKMAKRVYADFIQTMETKPTVREIAHSFDMEDFELLLKNAQEAQDRDTIRSLMQERKEFFASRE